MRATAFLLLTASILAFASDARAEAGPAPMFCEDPPYAQCADAAALSTCVGCASAACGCLKIPGEGCVSKDGGANFFDALQCSNTPLCSALGDLSSCNGKSKGDPCGSDRTCQSAFCYFAADGGYTQDAGTLACLEPLGSSSGTSGASSGTSGASSSGLNGSGDGGSGGGGADSTCGCSVPGAVAASAFAPLAAFGALAILRIRRRRSR
jgi:MYXO-CTERM domain-containing protein